MFSNAAILQATAAAVDGDIVTTLYALAVASYTSGYLILLAPTIALLTYDCSSKTEKRSQRLLPFFSKFILGLGTGIFALFGVSWFLTDSSWQFLYSTYGVQLLLIDLTPNIGLWWYFFIEMFDSFRSFFLGVFWLHMASYVGALTIRIR